MTTRVHVVNFGPLPVEVETNPTQKRVLFSQESDNFWVYQGQELRVREQEPNKEKPKE